MIKIINYLKLIIIAVLFLFLFIKFTFLPYPIALFFALSFLSLNYKTINIKDYKGVWLIIGFFVINAFSLIYSENFKEGFYTIQTQISIVGFPLLVNFDKSFFIENKKRIFVLFITAVVISIFVFSFQFVYSGKYAKLIELLDRASIFRLTRFFKPSIDQHPSYISMAYMFSIILLVRSININKGIYLVIMQMIGIFLILIFILLLNSRAALLSFLFIIIYFTLKHILKYKIIYRIIVVFIVLVSFFLFLKNTRFKENFKSFETATSIEQVDLRFSLWRNAYIVWKEKPIFGHGIGDTKNAIAKIHQERNITDAGKFKLNAHNQFLETAMQTGLVGLIILLLVFAIPLYQSIKKKQELLFLFLMICFINFLFESMLQRLAGVVFFSFWYSFLWFVYYKDDKVIENEE